MVQEPLAQLPLRGTGWRWFNPLSEEGTYRKVKIRRVADGATMTDCPWCHRGELLHLGTLVYRMFDEDLHYKLHECSHCCVITVLESSTPITDDPAGEDVNCHEEIPYTVNQDE